MNNPAVNVGQAKIAALEAVRQSFVVDAQAMQNGGIEIVDVHGIFDDVVAEIVGFAVNDTRFNTAAGHPNREAARVMVAAVICFRQCALAVDRAAEFAAPDDQSIIKHAALFEVFEQSGTALVDIAAL